VPVSVKAVRMMSCDSADSESEAEVDEVNAPKTARLRSRHRGRSKEGHEKKRTGEGKKKGTSVSNDDVRKVAKAPKGLKGSVSELPTEALEQEEGREGIKHSASDLPT